MYEEITDIENPNIEIVINDECNQKYYNFIWNALGEMAQERLGDLYLYGFFMSTKHRPVRRTGIILSLELQLMLKITSPPKKSGITRCVYVEVCKFDINQMKRGSSGKYTHFAGK